MYTLIPHQRTFLLALWVTKLRAFHDMWENLARARSSGDSTQSGNSKFIYSFIKFFMSTGLGIDFGHFPVGAFMSTG